MTNVSDQTSNANGTFVGKQNTLDKVKSICFGIMREMSVETILCANIGIVTIISKYEVLLVGKHAVMLQMKYMMKFTEMGKAQGDELDAPFQ